MLTSMVHWLQPPVFPDDEDKTRSALLLNVLLNTAMAAMIVLFVGVLMGDKIPRFERTLMIIAGVWLSIFGTRLMMLTGQIALAGMTAAIIIFIATTLTTYNIGSIRAPATSFYILATMIAGLTVSRRAIIWMASLSSISVIFLLLGEENGFLPPPTLSVSITQGITFTVLFAHIAILLYLMVKSIDEALGRARNELAERQRIEKEREKYIEKLDRQSAELERFTYTISHDLKSPVVTIKGFLGMLQKDIQENNHDKIERDLKRISDAAEKMGTLLSELLELSRIGRVINLTEIVDLGTLAQESLKGFENIIHSKKIEVRISPDLPVIACDRVRLKEVYENLIDNAIKHVGEQTTPMIELGVRTESEVILFVRDNGTGINPIYHERVFGLFEKLDASTEGTGIGLALVKRIIETHGGRIWVESEGAGKGSAFCFTIQDDRSTDKA